MTEHEVTLLAAALTSAAPVLAVLIGILVNNRQIESLRREMDSFRREMDSRFQSLEKVFTEKLLRVEQLIDARLSHLEEKLR